MSIAKSEIDVKEDENLDNFVEKHFLLIGGNDSKLHLYRLRLGFQISNAADQDMEMTGLPLATFPTLDTLDMTKQFFNDRMANQFNAMVQSINIDARSKQFVATSALGMLKVFSYKECEP